MSSSEIAGASYSGSFVSEPHHLYAQLVQHTDWDERMTSRKTASYGKAYNYSQIAYPDRPFPSELEQIRLQLILVLHFEPNNCLINYYPDGGSKMGFHSDQTDILEPGTGVAIVSLGDERILRFRNIAEPERLVDYHLEPGSLFYMDQHVQSEWLHAIPKSGSPRGRISLTYRRLL